MNNTKLLIFIAAIIVSVLIIFAVSWHSLEEIHYLKTFYPSKFTVEEAFYASAVELFKVIIISIPFFVIIASSFYCLMLLRKKD